MAQKCSPLFLTCETPLHAGSGDALGVVDLPIQRERHTSFPKIEASSLKGALREAVEGKIIADLQEAKNEQNKEVGDKKEEKREVIHPIKKLNIVFGFDESPLPNYSKAQLQEFFKEGNEVKTSFAGAIGFTDARLLLFPVKSLKGVFAWVTCPRVLKRFVTDMQLTNSEFSINDIPDNSGENECYLLGDSAELKIKNNHIVLEEYAFEAETKAMNVDDKPLQDWLANELFKADSYWYKKAKTSIVVLNDNAFKDFVNLSTEVITRTKIDNQTGTVQQGALFTEEYLPAESVLYSIVLANPEFSENGGMSADDVLNFIKGNIPEIFQIGGNATLGKGIVRRSLFDNNQKSE